MPTSYHLNDIYAWAKANIGRPVLLGYDLQRVNAQHEGQLLILLRLPWLKVPSVEIQITHHPIAKNAYELVFHSLPFHEMVPRPKGLRPWLSSQPATIDWIRNTRY